MNELERWKLKTVRVKIKYILINLTRILSLDVGFLVPKINKKPAIGDG